jgi:HEAT repeat protein
LVAILVFGLLVSCTSSASHVELMVRLEEAERAARETGRTELLVSRAIRGFESSDTNVRTLAAHALGRIRPRAATVLLARRLREEEDPDARRAVVEALTWIAEPEAAGVLRDLLRDLDEPLRALAIRGLGAGGYDDVRAIGAALEDDDAEVRLGAMLAFVRRPTIELSKDDLTRRLSADEDERIRWVAAQALAARPALASSLADTLAIHVLDRNFLVSYHVTRALVGLDAVVAFDEVTSLARDGRRPWLARMAAVETLGTWLSRDGSGSTIRLSAAQRDVVENVVVDATVRLAKGEKKPTPPLLASAIRRALGYCRGDEAKLWRGRLPKASSTAASDRAERERPAAGNPGRRGYTYLSPYLDPRPRGPRVLLEIEGGGTIVVELFADSAPHRVSILLELLQRGSLEWPRVETHADPPGVLVGVSEDDLELQSEVPPAEPSSRRIIVGTLVERPGARAAGRFLIALRPIPEWEGRVAVLGRVLLGQEALPFLYDGVGVFVSRP